MSGVLLNNEAIENKHTQRSSNMKALKTALLVTTLAITSASVFAQPTFNGD